MAFHRNAPQSVDLSRLERPHRRRQDRRTLGPSRLPPLCQTRVPACHRILLPIGATTIVARQFPMRFTHVRPMSINSSTPKITATPIGPRPAGRKLFNVASRTTAGTYRCRSPTALECRKAARAPITRHDFPISIFQKIISIFKRLRQIPRSGFDYENVI